jgi:glyoxylase-like metal-dependent hydrolase (beta-lactamase superfamily II)
VLERDRLYRIPLRGVNAYLVDDDGAWTLVDAGTPLDADRIRSALAVRDLHPADLDRVLCTHYDLDHVGTLGTLGLDPTVAVFLADPDAAYAEGSRTPPLSNHKGLLQRVTRPLLAPPTGEVRRVDEGDRVGGFAAYRTPGHTPGHVAYVHEDLGVAFVGDLVFGDDDGGLNPAPRIVCYDVDRNADSIRRAADRFPDVDVVAMGHGDPVVADGGRELRRVAGEP